VESSCSLYPDDSAVDKADHPRRIQGLSFLDNPGRASPPASWSYRAARSELRARHFRSGRLENLFVAVKHPWGRILNYDIHANLRRQPLFCLANHLKTVARLAVRHARRRDRLRNTAELAMFAQLRNTYLELEAESMNSDRSREPFLRFPEFRKHGSIGIAADTQSDELLKQGGLTSCAFDLQRDGGDRQRSRRLLVTVKNVVIDIVHLF